MKLNPDKNEPIEVYTRYSCTCGNNELRVEVAKFMAQMKEGVLDPMDPKVMYNAKMICSKCGLSGPGFMFDARTRSKSELLAVFLDYLQKEPDSVTFEQLANMVKCLVIKHIPEDVSKPVDSKS